MGDIKRKRGKFKRPKQRFNKTRIDDEKKVVKKYGLKNKKEIWKAEAEIARIRRRAKSLISGSDEEKEKFFKKLNHLGFNVKKIADVLALSKSDWMDRRLQTILVKSGLASTPKLARQLIVHKHVLVDGTVVNIPSFRVTTDLENKISLKKQKIIKSKVKNPEMAEEAEDDKE